MRRTRWAEASDRRLIFYAMLFGLPYVVVPMAIEVAAKPESREASGIFWSAVPGLISGMIAAAVFGLLARTLQQIECRERERERR